MFGKNEIVGKKYFDNAGEKLFVTSIFYTLQGEGPYAGMPAVFVRFAKCNLACSFCDTYFDGGDWLTLDQIDERIEKVISDYFGGDVPKWAQHDDMAYRRMVLVVTGGEPMLQKNIGEFLERMNDQFKFTQIESNGTLLQEIPLRTTLVVSPKCMEKGGKPTKYLQPNEAVLERANCLKFVMSADADSPYSSIPDWAMEWKEETDQPVYVSPMNIYNSEPQKSKELRAGKNEITLEERSAVDEVISFWTPGLINMQSAQANHEFVAAYCAKHGLRLNMQMHLFASLA